MARNASEICIGGDGRTAGAIKKTACMGLAAVLLATAGSLAQTTQTISFKVGGTARSGVVHVPAGVSKPPVVFFVHGYGGNGAGFANDTKADKVADREKFIAVYPSANGGAWSMYDTTEYPFLRMLLDTVDARYKIDRNRVYCAGFSQGGFISFGLGYKHPEIFAAVAPVSGHIPSFSTAAPLARPVPMFLTFGTNDISNVASFMADVSTWLKLDGCDVSSRKIQRPYPATNRNSTVARITYSCAQGSEVVIDSVVGGGHEWAMDTVRKVNTTEEVWAFFKRFTRSGTTSMAAGGRMDASASLLASYGAGRIRLQGAGEDGVARVTDLEGRLVASSSFAGRTFAFEGRPSGIYLVTVDGVDGRRTSRITVP